MGSLIGGAVTAKKKKKLDRQLKSEFRLSAEAGKEGERISQLRANFGTRQEKIQQLREGRIRRAAVIQSGFNAGVGQSSAVEGGASAATSAAIGNLSSLNVFQGFSEQLSKQNQVIADSQSRQQVLGVKQAAVQRKADFIGAAVDTGIQVASMASGGIGGVVTKMFK